MNQVFQTIKKSCRASWILLSLAIVSGCATVPEKDYSAYIDNMPRSILVLPPINSSVEVNAPYSYVTTATKPLGELGYYVFPIALVDVLMKENGMPLPDDMHSIPLNKLGEVFGADAVMYIHLKEFGQKFQLIQSVTKVNAEARLVDVDSGIELWNDDVSVSIQNSSSNQGGLLGAIISAAVTQVVADSADHSHPAARTANETLFSSLLLGPLHSTYVAAAPTATTTETTEAAE